MVLLSCLCQIENRIFFVTREEILSFDDPVNILKSKLHFPDERAKYFVKRFDRNGDGKLSESEFNNFKALISHT